MGIRVTDEKVVCLYDSTTGIAFGPSFEGTDDASPEDEADAFLHWYEMRAGGDWRRDLTTDTLRWPNGVVVSASAAWRAFLAEHPEAECPLDRDPDAYGIGYTGDSDNRDGVAVPTPCGCECHRREGGVFAAGRSR